MIGLKLFSNVLNAWLIDAYCLRIWSSLASWSSSLLPVISMPTSWRTKTWRWRCIFSACSRTESLIFSNIRGSWSCSLALTITSSPSSNISASANARLTNSCSHSTSYDDLGLNALATLSSCSAVIASSSCFALFWSGVRFSYCHSASAMLACVRCGIFNLLRIWSDFSFDIFIYCTIVMFLSW